MTKQASSSTAKEYLVVFGPALFIAFAGLSFAYFYVKPAPPDRIVISTGQVDGAYDSYASRYREILARNSVTLEIRQSAGSVENLQRLLAASEKVDAAFIQGGIDAPDARHALVSLGSLYYEPVWLFYRARERYTLLSQLAGKTMAVGEQGSGTRSLALQLLADNGISGPPTTLLDLGGATAKQALLSGTVDLGFFIAAPTAPLVRELLLAPGTRLMSFQRADAYTRVHRYLSRLTLPQGVIDLRNNVPPQDTLLIAPTANLVARKDLHPALVELLLSAATEVHGAGGLFERPGEFPAPQYLAFPLSDEARRYYKRGPSFLQRYLPFWAATFIDRTVVLLLPMMALLYPLFKVLPPAYRWRMRQRIYRWYRQLKAIDLELDGEHGAKQLERYAHEIDNIEDEVRKLAVPLSYTDQVYNLRLHIGLVRTKLADVRRLNAP